jgi:hypothetical protein
MKKTKGMPTEKELFDSAEKITDWPGAVIDPDTWTWHPNVQAFLSHEGAHHGAAYLWCCENEPMVEVFYDCILEDESEASWDQGAAVLDHSQLKGVEEFKAAIEAFNQANQAYTYPSRSSMRTKALILKP